MTERNGVWALINGSDYVISMIGRLVLEVSEIPITATLQHSVFGDYN